MLDGWVCSLFIFPYPQMCWKANATCSICKDRVCNTMKTMYRVISWPITAAGCLHLCTAQLLFRSLYIFFFNINEHGLRLKKNFNKCYKYCHAYKCDKESVSKRIASSIFKMSLKLLSYSCSSCWKQEK